MSTIRVAVLDVGSTKVRRRRNGKKEKTVGWAALDADRDTSLGQPWRTRPLPDGDRPDRGQVLDELVRAVNVALDHGQSVALGFECPCFVPVPDVESTILSGRDGERDRAFSAGAGAYATVAGLVESAWILERVRCSGATVVPERWSERCPLLLWEAFVTDDGKTGPDSHDPDGWITPTDGEHVRDAATAVRAFVRCGEPRTENSAVTADKPFNVLAAAALRASLTSKVDELQLPSYVVRALGRPTTHG